MFDLAQRMREKLNIQTGAASKVFWVVWFCFFFLISARTSLNYLWEMVFDSSLKRKIRSRKMTPRVCDMATSNSKYRLYFPLI